MDVGKIRITVKDFIQAVAVIFTLCGVWYKLYYEGSVNKVEQQGKDTSQSDSIRTLHADVNDLQAHVRALEDAELRRKTLEENRINFTVPLKKRL